MTPAEKKERRQVRKALAAEVLRSHFVQAKLYSTPKQMRSAARRVADQLLAGKNPGEVVPLEAAA